MTKLAIIGGSGLTGLTGLEINRVEKCDTPYGEPSAKLILGKYVDKEIIFLPRHGSPHSIPPHKINYRANLWALKEKGIDTIIAVNAVGGIFENLYPQRIVVPNQIIDYTWGRKHTFFEKNLEDVKHVDFSRPYDEKLRQLLIDTALSKQIDCYDGGTYGATQGPRLESAAEIARMEKDGCSIVGMTGMPEAGLARELDLSYVSISIVVNWAAGKSSDEITMAIIGNNMAKALDNVRYLLETTIPRIK